MNPFLEARRRMIAREGRAMMIRRSAAGQPAKLVAVLGVASHYAPGQIEGAIQQGDESVEVMHEDLVEAGLKPGNGDWLVKDGRAQAIEDGKEVYAGKDLIGYRLWVRG